jgi:hypothetical protein
MLRATMVRRWVFVQRVHPLRLAALLIVPVTLANQEPPGLWE